MIKNWDFHVWEWKWIHARSFYWNSLEYRNRNGNHLIEWVLPKIAHFISKASLCIKNFVYICDWCDSVPTAFRTMLSLSDINFINVNTLSKNIDNAERTARPDKCFSIERVIYQEISTSRQLVLHLQMFDVVVHAHPLLVSFSDWKTAKKCCF